MKGKLKDVGKCHGHYVHFECEDCGTRYPEINNAVICNGHRIVLCPWCRKDSKPWKNGRGK